MGPGIRTYLWFFRRRMTQLVPASTQFEHGVPLSKTLHRILRVWQCEHAFLERLCFSFPRVVAFAPFGVRIVVVAVVVAVPLLPLDAALLLASASGFGCAMMQSLKA